MKMIPATKIFFKNVKMFFLWNLRFSKKGDRKSDTRGKNYIDLI